MRFDMTIVQLLLPEIVLVVLATWIVVGSTFVRNRMGWAILAQISCLTALAVLLRQFLSGAVGERLWDQMSSSGGAAIQGPLLVDSFALFARMGALGMGFLLSAAACYRGDEKTSGESLGLMLYLVAGLMLAAGAGELILMFLGLELVSIPTYALLFLGRKDRATGEAAAKYFFLSILSSAIFLYGASFLYGISGTTSLVVMHDRLLAGSLGGSLGFGSLLPLATVLIVAGLGFKIAAVPFHFYAPDVFQGVTNYSAGILAVAPKCAGFVALLRLLLIAMPGLGDFGWQLVFALSILTMTLGNLAALRQNNIRRLLAYSSIAHSGYMLLGLAVALSGDSSRGGGAAAVVLYLAVYSLASLGAFCTLSYFSGGPRDISGVGELAGLGRSRPAAAAALAIFLFSLAGIPPLAGFWGKLSLLAGAVRVAADPGAALAWPFLILSVVGVLNAAVAAAYYLRIVAVMYFQAPSGESPKTGSSGALAAGWICAALVTAVGLYPFPVSLAGLAGQSLERLSQRAAAEYEPVAATPAENRGPL